MHLLPSIFEMRLTFKLALCLVGNPLHSLGLAPLGQKSKHCDRSQICGFISLDDKQLTN